MPYITGENRNQQHFLPEILDDYVGEENPVRVIDAFFDSLDIEEIGFTKTNLNRRGAPSYNPADLAKLYLYGSMNNVRSSRKLERETHVNIEVMWLMKKLKPDFKTIADFRKENKNQLKRVFKQFNVLCKEWNLFSRERIAVDGTKIRADNSKRNNYNKKKVERQLKYIDEKTEEYLKSLDENDKTDEVKPKYTAEEIREKIKLLKQRKEFYESLQKDLENNEDNEISTTDPDARMMDNKKNGLEVNYNVQIAVDEKEKLILATSVTNKPADQGHLNDMTQAAKEMLDMDEKEKFEALADKGYYQGEDLKKCDENGTITYVTKQVYANATGIREYYSDKFKYNPEEDVYICPEGEILYPQKHRKKNLDRVKYKNFSACHKCPKKDLCTKSKKGRVITRGKYQDFLDTVDARTAQNMDKYLERQMIVEHPFGTVKRTMGVSYFLTRGLESVNGEAHLIFLAYNMKRVINILGVKEILKKLEAKKAFFLLYFLKRKQISVNILKSEKYSVVL